MQRKDVIVKYIFMEREKNTALMNDQTRNCAKQMAEKSVCVVPYGGELQPFPDKIIQMHR